MKPNDAVREVDWSGGLSPIEAFGARVSTVQVRVTAAPVLPCGSIGLTENECSRSVRSS